MDIMDSLNIKLRSIAHIVESRRPSVSGQAHGIEDIFCFDIPSHYRHKLCQILSVGSIWLPLAERMQFSPKKIQEMSIKAQQFSMTDPEMLLAVWGDQLNHTVTELFVLLSQSMQYYDAMMAIRDLVDDRYHCLIQKQPTADLSYENSLPESTLPNIPYQELEEATDSWNENFLLGSGGFGSVCRGLWKHTWVAIKRLAAKDAVEQTLNEIRYLSSCRHDNILPLYGYSFKKGFTPCLVYQLMQGGSLYHRLFKRKPTDRLLEYNDRLEIAIGTARGLQYLHAVTPKPVIHGDMKPANILLDRFNQPRIGDFGLTREGDYDDASFSVNEICGTAPYLPANCRKKFDTKIDTFSFGVVVLELATGLLSYDKVEKKHLRNKIRDWKDEEFLLMDKTIDNRAEINREIFKILMSVGKTCSRQQNRPEMLEVLKRLEHGCEQCLKSILRVL